jgi:hypothetical protein
MNTPNAGFVECVTRIGPGRLYHGRQQTVATRPLSVELSGATLGAVFVKCGVTPHTAELLCAKGISCL